MFDGAHAEGWHPVQPGDRHGLIGGEEIEDPYTAALVVNAGGSVALFFIERHMTTPV